MSSWSELSVRANAAQLRVFGELATLMNPAALPAQFTALRLQRQPLENESTGAFERLWTTTAGLAALPLTGGTVILGAVEYVVQNVKPDEDPDSNGITIYLNRKRAL